MHITCSNCGCMFVHITGNYTYYINGEDLAAGKQVCEKCYYDYLEAEIIFKKIMGQDLNEN